MRIIIPNLHANWMMVKNSAVIIFKDSAARKHAYLLDYLLENPDYEVCTFLNDRSFSLYSKGSDAVMKCLSLLGRMEHRFIMRKNGIEKGRITVIKNVKDIRKDDIVLIYNVMADEFRDMEKVCAFKALSMIHFHGKANEEARIKKAGVNCLFGEVNLSKTSELFNKYYHINLPWIVHPFVFAERFKPVKPFADRKNKCFSTGTITYKIHPEFISVYGDPCDQPARKFVMDNPDFFKDTVDCYSSNYEEDTDDMKTISKKDLYAVRLYKRIYNRFQTGRQKKYFSFDMVEKFNDYKMHLLGEEIIGVPGIGFVEGMACGSAYIGIDSPMYRDYGLIPGVHYIPYDGTKEGLRATVEYYQKPENQECLERIAKCGCSFVREHFCGKAVAANLLDRLLEEQNKWLRDKSIL